MGAIDLGDVAFALPSGRVLFSSVSFRVADGQHAALVGANGTGKTTLLRLVAGDLVPREGAIAVDGRLRYLRQFVAEPEGDPTVRDLLLSVADRRVQLAAGALAAAETALAAHDDTATQMAYAEALAGWGDAGGYEAEVEWDVCCGVALRDDFAAVARRPLRTLSGGEQKRLALESLFRCDAEVLLLDEPDNSLDLSGKQWLEGTLRSSTKTVLYVSHDRAVLAATATRVITVEAGGAWTHGGPFAGYADARAERIARTEELRRRNLDERRRLEGVLAEFRRRAQMSDAFAGRVRSSATRLERFERDQPPPEVPRDQAIRMRLAGGRTGKRALKIEGLGMPGLFAPFDTEVLFGERVGVLGPNGTGKSHFLRLLAGEDLAHTGSVTLGARVRPGRFAQLHDRPDLAQRPLVELVMRAGAGADRGTAMAALRRYELHTCAADRFTRLSGGQQARVQLLLLELAGPTLLLLDEPTDNLDLASAEALEAGLAAYEGTILAVTHDRWFLAGLDRFLVFDRDQTVRDSLRPPEGWGG